MDAPLLEGGRLGIAKRKGGRAGGAEDVDDGEGEDGAEDEPAEEGAMRHGVWLGRAARPGLKEEQ